MKTIRLIVIPLLFTSLSKAQDNLSWLRESPIKKPEVFTSSQSKSAVKTTPLAALTLSSKNTRRRIMTVSNKRASTKTVTSAPKKKNESAQPVQFNPSELTPEQLNQFLGALEKELNKLNHKVPK